MEIAALVRMVRLITHNLLACHAKGCNSNNFPLAFRKAQLQIREADMNVDFLKNFYPKLEWNALVETAKQVLSNFSTVLVSFSHAYIARRYFSA